MHDTGAAPSPAGPSLAGFLTALAESGCAPVTSQPLSDGDDANAVSPVLARMDAAARAEAAGDAPALDPTTAIWAARLFYDLCRLTVCRELGADEIARIGARPPPGPRSPSSDWSADLVFRHLPQLFDAARHLSNADPFLDQLRAIAAQWPLSSPGIPGVTPGDLAPVLGSPALRRLYADRVVGTRDRSRLGHPDIDNLLRADLGDHRDLVPEFAERLFPNHHATA